jgi:hypothetical protein
MITFVTPTLTHYNFYNQIDCNKVSNLIHSNSSLRLVPIAGSAPSFLLDGILEIHFAFSPTVGSSFYPYIYQELRDKMKIIYDKALSIASDILETRKKFYSNVHIYQESYYFSSNFPLSVIECEFLLIEKLKGWVCKQLSVELFTSQLKAEWLKNVKDPNRIFAKVMTAPNNCTSRALFCLRELYSLYSLEEKMFCAIHTLDSLSLPDVRILENVDIETSLDDASLPNTLDFEVDFRTQFLQTALFSLESQNPPDNTIKLEAAFRSLYLCTMKRTLITSIQNHPALKKPLSRIPEESPFWHTAGVNKSWWDCIVENLTPQTYEYTLFPTPPPSEQ